MNSGSHIAVILKSVTMKNLQNKVSIKLLKVTTAQEDTSHSFRMTEQSCEN
jgi:hypothetical protein